MRVGNPDEMTWDALSNSLGGESCFWEHKVRAATNERSEIAIARREGRMKAAIQGACSHLEPHEY